MLRSGYLAAFSSSCFLLRQRGKTVWYDNEMTDCSTQAMEEGVKHSAHFLLFLSGDPEIVVAPSAEEAVPPMAQPAPDCTVSSSPAETEPEPQSPDSPNGALPTGAANAQGWNAEQFAAWLRDGLNFEAFADVALAEGVDGAMAVEMDKDDWKELGISGLKAAKIISQLKKLV